MPGPSFHKSWRQTAIEFCEDACSKGVKYILVEFPSYLMTWRCNQTAASVRAQSLHSSQPEEISSTSLGPLKVASATQKSSQKNVQTPPPEIATQQALGIDNDDDEFISQCKKELAIHIGPMADLMTKQTLNQSPEMSHQELIEALAAHIADPNAALSFRKACYSINGIHLL
ncbi:hypothetical protein AM1_A0355 (plasmid) [Acaryochloris marina MBIC11017]|uniref:DUF8082 domain-containing protein n=1 Tax=Acaryochloris marina (strain MBIC 11017) TaxID=329726 RepID=A8ZL05_ACAM1|nr:hypothetical protein AM1_A0355 [Acaryochloris marina MBIC11017]